MGNNFKPLMASKMNEDFTNVLVSGDGIRIDKAHDYCEVIERNKIRSSNGCVGTGFNERLTRADDVLKDVLKQLKKEGYVVMTKQSSDTYTGRFKATTYYLAGE